MTTNKLPAAKSERLIVREVDGETLVYDGNRDTATCLNDFAAQVWRLCDGQRTAAEIALELGDDERAVWLALEQLAKSQLLLGPIVLPSGMTTAKSRRELFRTLGVGAAVALPIVASIVVPTPAQAASCVGTGGLCAENGACCSAICIGAVCV